MTKKPMAAAIRTFVAGMKFPPAPEHGPSPNKELVGIVVTMLLFAHGIIEDSNEVCVDPALSQVAEMLHCSERSIKRGLKSLRDMGLLTQKERGHLSTAYTFHQTSARTTVVPAAARTTVGTARKSSGDNSASQRGQLTPSAGTTRLPAGTTVDPLCSKASGSSLEKNTLGGSGESRSGFTRDDFEMKNGKMVLKAGRMI
jgi:hypothetical protein